LSSHIADGTRHFGQSTAFTNTIESINLGFAVIFTLEAMIKLFALNWRYFDDAWNRFDFFIVLCTDVGLLLKLVMGLNISSLATILRWVLKILVQCPDVLIGAVLTDLRILRVGRVFRLLNSAKNLQMLFNALMLTLPSLGNISSLLVLMYFIFSVLGVQLFATVQLSENLSEQVCLWMSCGFW